MRRLFLATVTALAVMAIASPAAARVIVQSGEHDTFSRLVFPDAPGRSWTVDASSDGARITFAGRSPNLDVSSVADFLPRQRIDSIEFADGTLAIRYRCRCRAEVSQIPTGHMVIDIVDGADVAPLPLPARKVDRPDLPLAFPLAPIALVPGFPVVTEQAIVPATASPAPALQVRVHPSGTSPLVPGDDVAAIGPGTTCALEGFARDVLTSDPVVALGRIPQQLSSLLTGEDRIDPLAAETLAVEYLRAGFGAEAVHVSAMMQGPATAIAVLAAAIDGHDYPSGAAIDPACGPASATLALLDPAGRTQWDRADENAIGPFVDGLHPSVSATVLPRLRQYLQALGRDDILLAVPQETPEDPQSQEAPVEAGTDIAAVTATIAHLDASNGSGGVAGEEMVANAVSLRRSIPPGPMRSSLEVALAKAFALSGRHADAEAMVADGAISADALLDHAMKVRSPDQVAELAVRLRPYLTDGDAAKARAANLFRSVGLDATAELFSPGDAIPRVAATDGIGEEPWLARDLDAMVAVDPAAWTPRNHISAAVLDRNAREVPQTDLAFAAAALADSGSVSALVADLLAEPSAGVTGR